MDSYIESTSTVLLCSSFCRVSKGSTLVLNQGGFKAKLQQGSIQMNNLFVRLFGMGCM